MEQQQQQQEQQQQQSQPLFSPPPLPELNIKDLDEILQHFPVYSSDSSHCVWSSGEDERQWHQEQCDKERKTQVKLEERKKRNAEREEKKKEAMKKRQKKKEERQREILEKRQKKMEEQVCAFPCHVHCKPKKKRTRHASSSCVDGVEKPKTRKTKNNKNPSKDAATDPIDINLSCCGGALDVSMCTQKAVEWLARAVSGLMGGYSMTDYPIAIHPPPPSVEAQKGE